MALARDPTSAEVRDFLTTRSGAEIVQLMRAMREPAAQVALTATLLLAPPETVAPAAVPDKTKKALNAFVGFRCYYILNPIFKPWPMKTLSHMIGQMWEADPNKSLWSLMTKAWSAIRDQIGKNNAPLDQFFRIICPHLNIPSPETYLECQGWKVVINQEGTPTLSRDADIQVASLTPGFAHMALSVEDIIVYCQVMGYAQDYVADMNTSSPTFLGRSHTQVAEKNTVAKATTQAAGSTQALRVAARNKRRTKRQNARETGVVPALQSQIVDAYDTDISNVPEHGVTSNYNFEPFHFYNNMAQFLAGPAAHLGNGSGCLQNNYSTTPTTTNTSILQWTPDHTAFRIGADEDATLPSFDSASH